MIKASGTWPPLGFPAGVSLIRVLNFPTVASFNPGAGLASGDFFNPGNPSARFSSVGSLAVVVTHDRRKGADGKRSGGGYYP